MIAGETPKHRPRASLGWRIHDANAERSMGSQTKGSRQVRRRQQLADRQRLIDRQRLRIINN